MTFRVPTGHHVTMKAQVAGDVDVERQYTPVAEADNSLHFLIKTYTVGAFTPVLDKLQIGKLWWTLDIEK